MCFVYPRAFATLVQQWHGDPGAGYEFPCHSFSDGPEPEAHGQRLAIASARLTSIVFETVPTLQVLSP